MSEVIIDWPPKELSPNSRGHWATKAKAAKGYRRAGFVMAKQSGVSIDWEGEIYVWITFFPPDRRARDDDNLIASFKAARDGMAEALGVDDSRFRIKPWVSTTVVKGGEITVRFSPGPEVANG